MSVYSHRYNTVEASVMLWGYICGGGDLVRIDGIMKAGPSDFGPPHNNIF